MRPSTIPQPRINMPMERAAVAAAGVELQVVGHTGRWRLTPYPDSGNREWTLSDANCRSRDSTDAQGPLVHRSVTSGERGESSRA